MRSDKKLDLIIGLLGLLVMSFAILLGVGIS